MPASRFHDGQNGATYFVRAFVFGRELRIVGDDDVTRAIWKLADVKVAPELDPDGVATLTSTTQSGVLLVDDSAELESLRQAGIKPPGHKAWTRRHWVGVCAVLAVTLALGVLAVNSVPRWLADVTPIAWEQRLGQPAEALITASSKRCTNEEGQAALQRLVERLRMAGHIAMPVTISVVDDKTVNAFTLPGGHVLVLRGLIDTATDGPMLAGVIAHELGHVAHRDSLTLLLRGMGLSILLNTIGFGDGGAAAGVSNLMSLAYSRAAEAAADASAIDFLTKADLRADGLSRFFVVMEQREGTEDGDAGKHAEHKHNIGLGTTLSWFATHPATEARREVTARPETGDMPFTEEEWQAIRTMCPRK